ncbi:MAG: LPS assembly lipoprotein LptE [Bacteroidota bacterium]|nr:LPS assembly lipoprotein LptE [Bacteroidota bacterium]
MKYGFILIALQSLVSCYSFKGTSIPEAVNTFNIVPVVDESFSAPSSYPFDFAEALSLKIRRESKLRLNNENPDIIFKCKITQFNVNSQAPVAGATSAINRLTVVIEVEYISVKNEKENWKQSFNRFEDFSAEQNFAAEQGRLTQTINNLFTHDIFIKAFSNW